MKKLTLLLIILSIVISLFGCKTLPKNKINGNSISEYSIVYSDEDLDYSKRAAEYIKAEILERTQHDLPLVEDSEEAKTKYEIVVGNTERAISEKLDAETEGLEFAILADGGNVALEGDYFIIAAAAYFFIECYVPEADFTAEIPEKISVHTPIQKDTKNYIMLIGDGMGQNHTKLFEFLDNDIEYGDGEDFFYGNLLPYHGFSRTNSLSGTTDSAAGGTALACGIKTINQYIGRDENKEDVKSLTELAYEKGMSAGVMSTEANTGATPASFSAHADSRNSSSDIIKSQAEARSKYGLQIKCGMNYYTERYVNLIEDSVMDMLDTLDNNEKGFFLMYEEAHIDKHSHNNDMEGLFKAVVRFNQIIARVMEYAFYNPETMVLITADHETGGLIHSQDGTMRFTSDDHTSANVYTFSYGKGAEVFDGQTVENIQIAHTFADYMGDSNFGDQSEFQSLAKK